MEDISPRRRLTPIERVSEADAVELQKFPYPYQAAFTVASDIDSGSTVRFRAIHGLFCKRDLIRRNTPEWLSLGLTTKSAWYDPEMDAVEGLGLNLADSFFLIADPTTFGMYRPNSSGMGFVEDREEEANCAEFIKRGIKTGEIDCFHAFLHYKRAEVVPLLKEFYNWCESEAAPKPCVWINHSAGVTPSGLCPDGLQPNRLNRLARLVARGAIGPLVGRKPQPLRHAFVRYQGDSPGSRYYINDYLFANGLKFVWLNQNDLHVNRIGLPEQSWRGRSTILQTVTMDDGTRYHRFERCYGKEDPGARGQAYLRSSKDGCDASCLITEANLRQLCGHGGTCILYTHWTHHRSMPISDETIARFHLLAQWHSAGRIWIAPTSQLLDWTRRRTFLDYTCSKQGTRLLLEIKGIDDPNFGYQQITSEQAHGLCFRGQPGLDLSIALNGTLLSPQQVQRDGDLVWLCTIGQQAAVPGTVPQLVDV